MSRLQNGADVGREIYAQSHGELTHPVEDYVLFWPERKVRVAEVIVGKRLGEVND